MGTFTSILNLFKPATSDFIDVVADLNDNTDKLETLLGPLFTAWQSYTPAWSSDGTNPTTGNATLQGAYKQIGKTVWFRIYFVFGSTSSGGTGSWYWSLPVVPRAYPSGSGILANSMITDLGLAVYQVTGAGPIDPTGAGRIGITIPAGDTTRTAFSIGATQPFSWGTGDIACISVMYEAA